MPAHESFPRTANDAARYNCSADDPYYNRTLTFPVLLFVRLPLPANICKVSIIDQSIA